MFSHFQSLLYEKLPGQDFSKLIFVTQLISQAIIVTDRFFFWAHDVYTVGCSFESFDIVKFWDLFNSYKLSECFDQIIYS